MGLPIGAAALWLLLACGAVLDAPSSTSENNKTQKKPVAASEQQPVLFFSSDLNSYLEPCGCALYQMGGLARRATFLDAQGPVRLMLENGGMLRAGSSQDHLKLETILEVLGTLGYHGVNVGIQDLVFGVEELKAYAEYYQVPLLAGNLVSLSDGQAPLQGFRDVQLKSHRIRIIGLMAQENRSELDLLGLDLLPTQEALDNLLTATTENAKVPDHVVVMFQGTEQELESNFSDIKGITAILTAGEGEAPFIVDHFFQDVPVLYSGMDGKQVGAATISAEGKLSLIYAHDLEHTIKDRTDVRGSLDHYLDRVTQEDLLGKMGKYTFPDGNGYLGTPMCGSCHLKELEIWEKTKHSKAWETLQRVKHDRDPECVTCHVVGLDKESGFSSWPESAGLEDVGCESCHGPGLHHVERQTAMPSLDGDLVCQNCHVPDHSPKFDPASYLPQIKHW